MCGIFGIINVYEEGISECDIHLARTACNILSHRGPDQYGEWIKGNVYLGHRRLSIIDLSERGRQPMLSDDGNIAIAINGEIYNFRQLRNELGATRFYSKSDSEVILHGYETWGIRGLLQRIEGMFAFAVVDRRIGKVFLARDHVGIKPMYYGHLDNYTFWASELKAVKQFFDPNLLIKDNTSLYDFLTYRYIPSPKTLYKNCYKLEAGHFVEIELATGKSNVHKYWQLPVSEIHMSINEAVVRIRELIEKSVEEQLVSDVPLGFFLSGGIDSSVVVAVTAAKHNELSTFTIGYDEAKHDETEFAKIVAKKFGTSHTKRMLSVNSTIDLLENMERWYDEPFADTSALPTYHVANVAREQVAVVLTGDGADELFGGYRWYQLYEKYRKLQSLIWPYRGIGPRTNFRKNKTGFLRKVVTRFDLLSRFDPLDLYVSLLSGYISSEKYNYKKILEIDAEYDDLWHFRRYYNTELPIRKRMQYLDFHTYLPDDILTKVDRVTMAVSLEARVPLLSRSLVELAFSLPESLIYHENRLKGIFKYSYQDLLPDSILYRGKKGFSIPLHRWIHNIKEDDRIIQDQILQRYL